jgi:amidase
MKPTWGLVPYTGITPIEHTLDHAGPMSSTVTENALLLEAIAGPDEGLDPRQYGPQVSSYTDVLGAGVDGMKIGVLTEGFGQAQSELDVDEAVREAASRLSQLGARISEISIPEHTLGLTAVFPIMLQGNLAVLRANCLVTNWRGLYPTGLGEAFGAWRAQPNALSETMKIDLLLAEHLERNYRNRYYAKAQNLSRRLRRRYDQAFAEYDVLLMPTVPYKAPLLPAPDAELGQRLAPGLEACTNTGPFSCTGHPAMSVPCGVSNGLPIGMMLVGPWYGETAIYRVAHAFEQSYHQPDAPETS